MILACRIVQIPQLHERNVHPNNPNCVFKIETDEPIRWDTLSKKQRESKGIKKRVMKELIRGLNVHLHQPLIEITASYLALPIFQAPTFVYRARVLCDKLRSSAPTTQQKCWDAA